jgi:hypothetical protein
MLVLASCGGDKSTGLSESQFLDALSDVCGDTQRDLDRIDLPTDADDTERFAVDVSEVYADAQERLAAIRPPDDLSRDFGDFRDVIAESIDLLADLEDAGKDGDEDEIAKIVTDLQKISDDQAEIAADLDLPECAADESESSDTTTPATTPAETTAVTTATTVPSAPLTLPVTLPPATAAPVATTAPPATGTFTVMDVAAEYFAPSGFTLVSKTPDQGTLDAVTNSELNAQMDRFGVATLVNDEGTEIADVWIGVAISDVTGMPPAWIALDCGTDGILRQSEGGILGIVCPAAVDSPFWEIFTATSNAIGISVYTRLPDIPGDLVADAFLEANL